MAKGLAKRGLLGALSWILLAGALVMLWFVILSGVREHTPLNKVWFLQADTSGIAGARHPLSQWTYFKICGDNNSDCDKAKAALPFGYAWYDDSTGAPSALVGNHGNNTTSRYYYYMWRFGWVFYFIGFILANFAILSGLLACLKIITLATGLLTLAALFFMTLAACLMTAVFVRARNKFQDEGRYAKVGPYAFGFTWAAVVLLFLCSLIYILNAFVHKKKHHNSPQGAYAKEGPYNTYQQGPVQSGYTGGNGYTQPLPQQAPQSSVGTMGSSNGQQQQGYGQQQGAGIGGNFEDRGQRSVVHDDAPAPTMRGERRGFGGRLFNHQRQAPHNGAPPV